MSILCAKECKCDIADWEGYIGTTRVHSLAGTKMRDRQIWGVNLPSAFVCLESERGVSISDIIRTVHTLGRP